MDKTFLLLRNSALNLKSRAKPLVYAPSACLSESGQLASEGKLLSKVISSIRQ